MANGLFAGGDGTELNPFLIEDAHDLDAIRNDLKVHYKLISDIDLNVAPYNEGEGWIPIDNGHAFPFIGHFKGEGHIINNLFINRPTVDRQGLFGTVRPDIRKNVPATITNVGIEHINIVGQNYVGGLVGHNSGGLIDNCYSTGIVKGANNVGGLIGANANTESHVETSSIMTNCWTSCSVSGSKGVGGLVGAMGRTGLGYHSPKIENCHSFGTIAGISNVGGLVGRRDNAGNIINSFWDIETSNQLTSVSGSTGLTTQQMQTAETFIDAGWDTKLNDEGNPIWVLKDGRYPRLWFGIRPLCLVKSNNKYYSYQDANFIEVDLTEENFEKFNVNLNELLTPNNQGIKPLMTLENPGIVHLSDEENPRLHIKGFRDLRPLMESNDPKILIHSEVEPEIIVSYLPDPQLIIPTGDIVLRMLDKIYEFTIHSNKNHGGEVRIIFSIDSGISWITYNITTSEFEEIDIDSMENVKKDGMDPDVFNAIGEKWNEIVVNNKIRFAYYLEINSMNDIAEVDKLEIKMDMHGRWKKLASSDYSYEYDNEHIYISFFKDGSYKINYQG